MGDHETVKLTIQTGVSKKKEGEDYKKEGSVKKTSVVRKLSDGADEIALQDTLELSDEWKAVFVEEQKLKIKKLIFGAKLGEALI